MKIHMSKNEAYSRATITENSRSIFQHPMINCRKVVWAEGGGGMGILNSQSPTNFTNLYPIQQREF
jgi:hypothetical protein